MKKNIPIPFLFILLLVAVNTAKAQLPAPDTLKTTKGNIVLQPVFHAALVVKWQNTTIYIDPYNGANAYKGLPAPDLILITHIHRDHLDTGTLNSLNTAKAKLIVPQAVADQLPVRWKNQTTVLNNNNTYNYQQVAITAVPMYDLPQEAGSRHVKDKGNGYILALGGKQIYISGDTDDIPEMRNLKNIDVAFVCMNQPFTMTAEQAADAVLEFKPKIVYPFHYRNMNGFTDVEAFKKIVNERNSAIEVRIRNWYSEPLKTGHIHKTENVIYGMYSGTALTMDVYKPEQANKLGIIVIPGTAFGYAYNSNDYNQPSATEIFTSDTSYFGKYARMLADKGYTLFVINHRLAPNFHYADIIGDCQRAVQYIRYNAAKYEIDPDHIGAFGYSSGASLCALLGVTDSKRTDNAAGIDAVSSKVQTVVTLAARFDFAAFNHKEDTAIQNPIITRVLYNYIGELPMVENGNYVLTGKYAQASPITHVSSDDASFLIYCSSDDPLVPHRQETNMYNKLRQHGIDTQIHMAQNEQHTPIPDINEVDRWFLKHLKK